MHIAHILKKFQYVRKHGVCGVSAESRGFSYALPVDDDSPFYLILVPFPRLTNQGVEEGTTVRIIDTPCRHNGGKQVCPQSAPILLYLLFRQQDAAILIFTVYSAF